MLNQTWSTLIKLKYLSYISDLVKEYTANGNVYS